MVTNANWPLTVTQVDFANGLNTVNAPSWVDLSARCWSLSCDRGKQYELDETQAGVGGIVFADQDETLNPTNGSSPYSPNVLPYRPIVDQAMWPPAPVGAAVNTCGTAAGYDPSFETTAVGATPPFLLTFNNSPTVQAANPQFGTKSLQWSVTGGAPGPEQVAGFTVTTIPGQQYTASVYYRQTTANTGQLFVNSGPASSTTTTTGAYVRLTVTFTATDTSHQLFVGSLAPTLAGTVNIDGFQVEPGASASTFSTTGPVIYGVHRGFVERWPSRWNHQGMYGFCELTTVDAFAALAAKKLRAEYTQALLATDPLYYWPLTEPNGARTFGEASGNNGTPLELVDGPFGAGNMAAGSEFPIAGLPGNNGLGSNGTSVDVNLPLTVAAIGIGTSTETLSGIGGTPPFSLSWAMWVRHTTEFVDGSGWYMSLMNAVSVHPAMNPRINWFQDRSTISPLFDITMDLVVKDNTGTEIVANLVGANSDTDLWGDNKAHLYVITWNVLGGGGNSTMIMYQDGVQIGISAVSTATWAAQPWTFTTLQIGGQITTDGFTDQGPPNANWGHFTFWNRILSAGEVAALWAAGSGHSGETSGARIARYLSGNYGGKTLLDTGQSVMGPSDLEDKTTLLDACQAVALSENGNFWVDGDGVLQFAARTRRYLATSSTATFGEDQAGGEYPYEADVAYDFDPTLVYNDIEVTQSGGIVAAVSDTASQAQYGPRSYERTINVLSVEETRDAANWILYTHKDPQQRIATLVLKPSANPALWPIALGAEVGQRVTVKRRTTAGYTMTADYFIEQISHDRKPDTWTVSFQMSPAAKNQVWLLGDATYGVLGSTTLLGY
jgi:hypothetical protein